MTPHTKDNPWVNSLLVVVLFAVCLIVTPILLVLRFPLILVLAVWLLSLLAMMGRLRRVLRHLFKPLKTWSEKRIAARGGPRVVSTQEAVSSFLLVSAAAVVSMLLIYKYIPTDIRAYAVVVGGWIAGLTVTWKAYKRSPA
jgi:hypothetical protein